MKANWRRRCSINLRLHPRSAVRARLAPNVIVSGTSPETALRVPASAAQARASPHRPLLSRCECCCQNPSWFPSPSVPPSEPALRDRVEAQFVRIGAAANLVVAVVACNAVAAQPHPQIRSGPPRPRMVSACTALPQRTSPDALFVPIMMSLPAKPIMMAGRMTGGVAPSFMKCRGK